jgi:4-diphosphocytidyl-2-C-methyl-D-erythritol kinase
MGLRLPAPAKLNLHLRILGQREDGYHNLQTAFQFIDWCDFITFNQSLTKEVTLSGAPDDIPLAQNLIIKAAMAIKPYARQYCGVDIHLEKKLPMGAGLGGGSSNAATTLVALNQLWKCDLSNKQLRDIGAKLGADVPIFVYGQSAWAEGIGEQLTPFNFPEVDYLLLLPNVHVSTAKIFTHKALTRDSKSIKIRALTESEFGWNNDLLGYNDCEPLVMSDYPEIAAAKNWLNAQNSTYMTGTGSCLYSGFDNRDLASIIAARCPRNWSTKIVKGNNCSLLKGAL